MKTLFFLAMLLFCESMLSQSFTYYVNASTGSNINPGTISQPWQTQGFAFSQALSAGQTVGIYSGSAYVLLNSGPYTPFVTTNLLGQYDFIQGASSTTLYDVTGTNNGTATGTPAWTTTGATLSGGAYFLTGNVPSIQLGQAWSVILVVRITSTTSGDAIFSFANSAASNEYMRLFSGGVGVVNAGYRNSTAEYTLGSTFPSVPSGCFIPFLITFDGSSTLTVERLDIALTETAVAAAALNAVTGRLGFGVLARSTLGSVIDTTDYAYALVYSGVISGGTAATDYAALQHVLAYRGVPIVNQGITSYTAPSLTLHSLSKPIINARQQAGVLYVIDSDGAGHTYVESSTNNGQSFTTLKTWNETSITGSGIWVAANGYIYASPFTLSAASSDVGIWRSTDYGATWTRQFDISSVCTINCALWSFEEDSGGRLYASEYTESTTVSAGYIYESADNGTTWTAVYTNSSLRHMHKLAYDSWTDSIYATSGDWAVGSFNLAEILVSPDHGSTWNTVANAQVASSKLQFVGLVATPTARLFGSDMGQLQGIYRTTDDTTLTRVLDPPWNISTQNIQRDPVTGWIYVDFLAWSDVPTQSALYVSKDDGLTWTLLQLEPALAGYDGTGDSSQIISGQLYKQVQYNGAEIDGTFLGLGGPANAFWWVIP